jgi:DDE superfamily endonuclease
VAIACTKPPTGRAKWTLQLLADQLVLLTDVESVSADTVGRRLQENELKPWQKKMWCIPHLDADYVANMEDMLDLYEQPRDPKRPLGLLRRDVYAAGRGGEASDPRITRQDRAVRLRVQKKRDCEPLHVRRALEGWRHVKVTDRKANADFAKCMRDLVDIHYAEADVIRVVMDNLSTHRPGALYQTLPPEEGRRILRKLEFHYTLKRGSWLNMAEIEIGVLNRQCLDRRIGDRDTLGTEVAAWESDRNAAGATIEWMFDLNKARKKLTRAYTVARGDSANQTAAPEETVEAAA